MDKNQEIEITHGPAPRQPTVLQGGYVELPTNTSSRLIVYQPHVSTISEFSSAGMAELKKYGPRLCEIKMANGKVYLILCNATMIIDALNTASYHVAWRALGKDN